MSQKIINGLFGLLAAGSLVVSARAQSNLVYAVEFNQPTNRFGTINLLNGNFTQIATIGSTLINDIAYCPVDGTLYGIQNTTTLVTFNKTNGAISTVATLSMSGIESMAFRYSDGVLFGCTQSGLYTINPTNGNTTFIGSFGSPPHLNNQGQNIRFAQDDNLYISNTSQDTDIYRIDTTNGSAIWVGEAVGIPYLMLMNGDNYMYGVYINLGSSTNPGPKLVSFDLTSFVDGGTNGDGSTHQISIAMVGAGTNFPINFIFSGSVSQPVTNLTVPVSAVGPSDQTACSGSTVVFSTVASGTPPYSYTWLKNNSTISGETGSSLTLNEVTTNDAATYSVIVAGAMGTVTNSAILTVNESVSVTVPPASQTTVAGSNATFSVTATGTGLSYQWLFGGSVIGTESSLTLDNVTTNQAGIYTVIVSGVCGSVTNSATLTVNVPVTATPLSDLVCSLGGNATFSTVASGTGPFSYVWLKNGEVIAGQDGDSLTLHNVSVSDVATYSVIVSGACGGVTNSATLTLYTGSGGITITVIPALAPNADNSPSWAAWVSNAVTALLNSYAAYGDPASPSYYQQLTNALSVTNNLVTAFPSWNGLADPGTTCGPNFASETGNRLHFGFDIKGGTNFISIAQLSFVAHSTDTNNTLDYSFPAGAYTYSSSYVGIIYGPGGANTYITSGAATQLVNEIVGRGSGNAWWAATNGLPDLACAQSNLNVRALQLGDQPFVFGGTYTLNGVSGQGQVTFNPALPNVTPAFIGSPTLTIMTIAPSSEPDAVVVGWPAAATGFVLQTNIDLLTTNWGDYQGTVDSVGGTNRATIDTPTGCLFFRLKR